MHPTRWLLSALAATALVAAPAHALTLRMSDGVTTIQQTDGGTGQVTFNGAIGQWIANVTTGFGPPILPENNLDLNSVNVSNLGTPGFLDIWLSETDFTTGGGASILSFIGAIGGTTRGMVTYWLWVDDGNTLFGDQYVIGPGSSSTLSFADQFGDAFSLTDEFSMTLYVRINHGNGPGLATSFNYTGFVVPEPGTLALLGAGLLGLVYLRRRISR